MPSSHSCDLPNSSPRNIAVNCLLRFEYRSELIQDSLDKIFQLNSTDPRDRKFASELAYGACRRRITLDSVLSQYCDRTWRKVDPYLRQILRIGLYQLLFSAGVADYAAVSEAVHQAHTTSLRNAEGFINAVLRSIQRDLEKSAAYESAPRSRNTLWIDHETCRRFKKPVFPDPAKNIVKYFTACYGYPQWLVERWVKAFGRNTAETILQTGNSRPILSLRINTLRIAPEAYAERLKESGYTVFACNSCIQIAEAVNPSALPGFDEGHFYVQDPTAANIAPRLHPKPGMKILDLCAAPGGKATHLAEWMRNEGYILACDVSLEKLSLIQQNAQRLGIRIVETCLPDQLDSILASRGPFDAVLADVPCSNTGVLARRPEARHTLNPAALGQLKKIQLDLLHLADKALKPGGSLLYSTCSIEPVENSLLLPIFFESHPSYTLCEEQLTLPRFAPEQCKLETIFASTADLPWHDGGYFALLTK